MSACPYIVDYGRVFNLDITGCPGRFRALETITATRCAHERTALFYITSARFVILLNNSTSKRVLKFVRLSLDAAFMQHRIRQIWLFHSKCTSTVIILIS
jgi:hypothetical protein